MSLASGAEPQRKILWILRNECNNFFEQNENNILAIGYYLHFCTHLKLVYDFFWSKCFILFSRIDLPWI